MATLYNRHTDLRLTALAGEGVVLHLGERRYFTVNQVGLTILEGINTPSSITQLVDRVTAEYDVSREEAERTTLEFLTRCVDAKLVEARE